MNSPLSGHLLDSILKFFVHTIDTEQFNGTVAESLLSICPDRPKLLQELRALAERREISFVFSKRDINPHIKRLWDAPMSEQLLLLDQEPLDSFCVYPTTEVLEPVVGPSKFIDKPFTRRLALAEAQLDHVAFDMGVLERYCSDPMYQVKFHDYMGTMSIVDEYFTSAKVVERDKVSLQTFGLGVSENKIPVVIVFLRYLADLSSEHQQYWNSYSATGHAHMFEQYFDSSIRGEFWKNRSVRHAIECEMRLINKLTGLIIGEPLFAQIPEDSGVIDLTAFLRPTSANFEKFVHALDKVLSENIRREFFNGRIPLNEEILRKDGRFEMRARGTISLLESWLKEFGSWHDEKEMVQTIIQPLREVRKIRQKPAHKITVNRRSEQFYDDRKKLLWSVLNSLANIRSFLSSHPSAIEVKIPSWLDDGKIDVI